MKKLSILIILFLFFLVACGNKFASISKRFEDEGYKYSERISSTYSQIVAEYPEDVTVKPHVFTSGLKVALILEFTDIKKMAEAIEESPSTMRLIEDLNRAELINGNCLLIPFSITNEGINEMINIFQGKTK